MKHLYSVRSASLGKIFCNFRNNPMVLLILFDAFVKCSSNFNLLSKVNPKCFCDDAWETLLLKRKGGWQAFFSFLEKLLLQPARILVRIRIKTYLTAQKTKFSIKDFFSKCDQIPRKRQIWSHLLMKSLKENFIFCAVSSTKKPTVLFWKDHY